jgi:hypothetical protein
MKEESIIRKGNMQPWTHGKESDIWVSEAIWGHRLKEQPLHALLAEFLNMAEGMLRQGKFLHATEPQQDIQYQARKAKELRVILFHNPTLEQVAEKHNGSNEDAWAQWLKNIQEAARSSHPSDFSYLKDRFPNFRDFLNRVHLIRRSVMNPGNNKKWSHQLLFPMGPSALYVPADDKFGRDRTLFTRSGELVYLMLSRADERLREELAKQLSEKLKGGSQKDNITLGLLPGGQGQFDDANGGTYLPYLSHPAYNRLAEDLLNLANLELPENDVFDVMKHLIAFNLYLYALETSNHWCGTSSPAILVCEVMNTKSDVVRQYSGVCKRDNEDKALKAVENYCEQLIENNQGLCKILADEQQTEDVKVASLDEFLSGELSLKRPPTKITVEDYKKDVMRLAKDACRRNVIPALASLGRIAGLTTKQGTNRLRYAPSDSLIRALVLANVPERVEEVKLLDKLFERYRIVISETHASQILPEQFVESSHYEKNKERFTRRLMALGLATRMSDACTYVKNPYKDAI